MHPPVSDSRRDLGRFGIFLARGIPPRLAWWLAHRGALRRHDYRQVPFAVLESAWRADPTWTDLEIAAGRVRSRTLQMDIEPRDLLAADYSAACALHRRGFAVQRQAGGLRLKNDTWTLDLHTAEHLNMAREIFLDECYALRMPGRATVIDIGGNIGLASLYFAAQSWVNHVHVFEPFPATFQRLQSNLEENPRLAAKVTARNVGLSDRDARVAVEYDPEWSGSMSVGGVGSWRSSSAATKRQTEIMLETATAAVRSVKAGNPQLRVVAKIDCEGSEFAILKNLEENGALTLLDVVVMEWHGRDPEELLQRLEGAGFVCQPRPLSADRTLGLIVACRA